MNLDVRLRIAVLGVLAVLFALGANCNKGPGIVITSHTADAIFSNAASIAITGRVTGNPILNDVTVNDVSVLPLAPDNTFAIVVPLDPVAVINPIVATLDFGASNTLKRDRLTVIVGDGLPGPGGTGFVNDGDFSLEGIALRLNDTGLDQAEPVIEGNVNLDLATLLPVGTVVIDNTSCGLWTCDIRIISPAPSISGFGLDVDSQTNSVDGLIDINDPRVHFIVDGGGFLWPGDCNGRLDASLAEIDGNYGLDPDAIDPTLIDVTQNGSLSINFTGFSNTWTSGPCDIPIIGDIIDLIIGDIEGDVLAGLEAFLNDPDGAGPLDGPVADEIEVALAAIEIAGPIGQELGVDLEAPLFGVFEDVDGLTLDSDARITASMPALAAPDLTASYHVNEGFPALGATTPVGALPYDLGLCISSSAFNQLLKAEVESGLLLLTGSAALTEIEIFGSPQVLDAGYLSLFIPGLALLDPATAFKLEVRPRAAPHFTGAPGPGGMLGELQIGHLLLDLKDVNQNQLFLSVAVDVDNMGVDLDFVAGQLEFTFGTVTMSDVNADVLINNSGVTEVFFEQFIEFLLPNLLPDLGSSLGTFPLPTDFLGLQLQFVEVARTGEFYSLFFDLVPGP